MAGCLYKALLGEASDALSNLKAATILYPSPLATFLSLTFSLCLPIPNFL
jgi:hypothetical protein